MKNTETTKEVNKVERFPLHGELAFQQSRQFMNITEIFRNGIKIGETGNYSVTDHSNDHEENANKFCKAVNEREALIKKNKDLVAALQRVKSYIEHGEGNEPSGLRYISVIELIDSALSNNTIL